VDALTASEAYYAAASPRYKAGTPWSLPFLAMAHHGLGEPETARAILTRLRDVMKNPDIVSHVNYQAYLSEAEKLIEGKAR
jgi:hypothetical protein